MHQKFQAFDPFNSFSSKQFVFLNEVGENAWLSTQNLDDVLQLWHLGYAAFQALGEFEDRTRFNASFCEHLAGIKKLAETLNEGSEDVFQNEDGGPWTPAFHEWPSAEIVIVFSQISASEGEQREYLSHHCLFACLEEIDSALGCMALNQGHLDAVMAAVRAFMSYQAISTENTALQRARSELALHAAKERHARDPRQAEKKFVFECWKDWRVKPENYIGKAAFARAMLEKCEHLTSQKKIEDWCREWEGTQS